MIVALSSTRRPSPLARRLLKRGARGSIMCEDACRFQVALDGLPRLLLVERATLATGHGGAPTLDGA
jgi:hypothetical protein